MAKLGDVCVINMGQSPDSSTYNEKGDGIPFFQGNADFGEVTPNARIWCTDPTKIAQKDDILISVRAPIGALNMANTACCIGRGLAALTPNKRLCSGTYLWYALSGKVTELNSKGTGSTFKAINKKVLAETEIPLPPLETQRHIAAVLDKVSALIALRRQQLDKLDELVKVRFVEMFGDPVTNSKGLVTRKGSDFFTLTNGKFVPEEKRRDEGIPAYGGNGISWYTDEILVAHDTIVVGRVGVQSGNVPFAKGPLWVTDNAMYISDFNKDQYDLRFLCALMEHIDFTRFQDAGDLKKITQKPFMQLSYIAPSIQEQKSFITFVEQNDKAKLAIQKGLEKLETLKKALMQEYFG